MDFLALGSFHALHTCNSAYASTSIRPGQKRQSSLGKQLVCSSSSVETGFGDDCILVDFGAEACMIAHDACMYVRILIEVVVISFHNGCSCVRKLDPILIYTYVVRTTRYYYTSPLCWCHTRPNPLRIPLELEHTDPEGIPRGSAGVLV